MTNGCRLAPITGLILKLADNFKTTGHTGVILDITKPIITYQTLFGSIAEVRIEEEASNDGG